MIQVFFGSEFLPLVVKEIQVAEEEILVVCYEWNWYEGQRTGTAQDVNRELAIASKRGVKVKALLHNESMRRALGKLNRNTARHLRRAGAEVKMGNTRMTVHAKVWVFDRERAVVGSHNISSRAVGRNLEAGVLFDDRIEVLKVVEWFEGVWGRGLMELPGQETGDSDSASD